MKYLLLLGLLASAIYATAQTTTKSEPLPYQKIPDYPKQYTNETIVARMVDGLGFRFYWATEGLRSEDLAFKPSPEARTTEETIDHIMGLSTIILNAILNKPNVRTGEETSKLSFEEKRTITLNNLNRVSESLKTGKLQVKDLKITQQRDTEKRELPFWNVINGPIEDAVWHVGQVVSFRRSSGNPINPKVNVLTGTVLP